MARPLHQLAEALLKRSLVIVISDLLDDPAGVVRGLRHLRSRGTDVIVFQLLDPDELTFPFRGATRFRDFERRGGGDRRSVRRAGRLPARAADPDVTPMTASCASHGIDYVQLDTSQPLDRALTDVSVCHARGGAERHELPLPGLPRRSGRGRDTDRAASACGARSRATCRSARCDCCGNHRCPRRSRRRLRDLLLLAARVLALSCWPPHSRARIWPDHPPRRHGVLVVALDRSFSMDAPGRFAHALSRARAAIDRRERASVSLSLHSTTGPTVVAEPGTAAAARAALGRIQPTYGGTRYTALFDKASDLVEQAGGRLIVITDLQQSGWDDRHQPALAPGLQTEVVDVGPPTVNLAIAGLRTEPDRVVATIRNTGPQPRAGQLRLEVEGRQVGTAEYQAGGESSTDVSIPVRTGRRCHQASILDDPQGLAADNRRFVIAGAGHDEVRS